MKNSLLFILFMSCYFSRGQTPQYYADIVKGQVFIQKDKITKPLKPNTLIYKEDVLTLKEGAEITLVNNARRYLEIKLKGVYKVADLLKLSQKRSSSVTEKYFDMVWEKIKNSSGSSAINVENVARSFGGVSRGACDMKMFPFGGGITSDDTIRFSWTKQDSAALYTFTLTDRDKKQLAQVNISDTQYLLSLKPYLSSGATEFSWSVQRTYSPCGSQTINTLTWIPIEKYEQVVKQLVSDIPDTGDHRYYLAASQKLLDNGLYLSAAGYLLKALPGDQ